MVAICAENRAILPDEVGAIKDYIARHRTVQDPFDIVVILWSEGMCTPEEQREAARYEDAGVTWWLEDLSLERFQSIEDARKRLHKGPPRV